ncbi:MAG: hypothetical protein AB8B56_06055 [Crocinitomicaceae bacterium]
MKNILIGIFSMSLLASCGKFTRNAEIDRDCTGTYLRLNNRDYLICNPTSVSSYADGSSIKVKYQTVYDCNTDPNQSICELYHKHYGTVEITDVE